MSGESEKIYIIVHLNKIQSFIPKVLIKLLQYPLLKQIAYMIHKLFYLRIGNDTKLYHMIKND
jgi:hypothetical protein